jgi:hypothetical protein
MTTGVSGHVICRVINRMENVSVTTLKLHSNADLSDASSRYSQDWNRKQSAAFVLHAALDRFGRGCAFHTEWAAAFLECSTKSRLRAVSDRSI